MSTNCSNPITPSALRQNWSKLSLLERARAVAQFRPRYSSNRALAVALSRDEGSVRRLLKLSTLKPTELSLVLEGKVTKALRAAEDRIVEERRLESERVIREEREAAERAVREEYERLLRVEDEERRFIDGKVALIMEWLKRNSVGRPYADSLLEEIEVALYFCGWRFDHRVALARPGDDPWVTIEGTRPAKSTDESHWMNQFVLWGARWMPRIMPDAIRDRVLPKARNEAAQLP